MKSVKTHTGIIITRDGEKRMKLHETETSWVVARSEAYDKKTGRRWGAPLTRRRLLLDSITLTSGKQTGRPEPEK